MKNLNFYLLLIAFNLAVVNCVDWFDSCDTIEYVYTPITYFRSKWYSTTGTYKYDPGSSCRVQAIAPPGHYIKATCNLVLDNPVGQTNCASQRFYMSRDGDKKLMDAEYWCGTFTGLTRTSIGNEMTLAYTSNYGGSGRFECSIVAVPITQLNCDCGWSVNAKIVNGTQAYLNEFTSMVGFRDKDSANIFCAGAIISDRFIVTGAHCFVAYTIVGNMELLVGDHDYTIVGETKYEAIYYIETVRTHELYKSSVESQYYDIAIVKTTELIKFNRGVAPACLPLATAWASTTFFDGKNLEVCGWGATEFAGPTSDVLLKTNLTVISNTNCVTQLPKMNIVTSQLCTFKKSYDTCQRDSGGSLYYLSNGRRFTVATVSFGYFCGGSQPSVNTRISSFVKWIQDYTKVTFCSKL